MKPPLRCQPESRRPKAQAGFSLIELMVAITLGMLVVGAALSVYLAGLQTQRVNTQVAQMNDDGLAALAALSSHLTQADFNPDKLNLGQTPAVFACPNGFVDERALALTCAAAGSPAATGSAISVAYLADPFNTAVTGSAAAGATTLPTDCLGNKIQAIRVDPSKPGAFRVSEARLFVSSNSLMCQGNGGSTEFAVPSQPLVDNVEGMTLTFAVADPAFAAVLSSGGSGGGTTAVGYLTAAAIHTPANNASEFASPAQALVFGGLSLQQRWALVVGVRVCLVMRSEIPIVFIDPQLADYVGCDGTRVSPPDRRLRKAFVTTVAFRNRLALRYSTAAAASGSGS